MKSILLFVAFISFANLQAQDINLRTMTKDERIRYVSHEATRALDRHLYDFKKRLNGPNTPEPQYYALTMSYTEDLVRNDEEVSDFYELYGKYVTDYTLQKNDYTYTISFVSNPRLWKPLEYVVVVLNNGKALTITILSCKYDRIIYNK